MHSTGAISLQTNPAPTYRAQFSFKAQTFRFQDQDDKEDAIWTEKTTNWKASLYFFHQKSEHGYFPIEGG